MSDTTTVNEIETVNTDAERVYNLNIELAQMEQQKKDSARGFRDEINRIKGEIRDILKSAGEDVGEGLPDT